MTKGSGPCPQNPEVAKGSTPGLQVRTLGPEAELLCLKHPMLTFYKLGAGQPSLQAFQITCIRADSEDSFPYLTAPDVFPEPSILS